MFSIGLNNNELASPRWKESLDIKQMKSRQRKEQEEEKKLKDQHIAKMMDPEYAYKLSRQVNKDVLIDKNNIVDTFASRVEKKGAI